MLYELATRKEGYHSARDIADGYRVPEAFVRKILLDLRRAGLVTAQKGRSGGYRLAHPPEEIKLGQLLQALEPETPSLVYGRQRGGGYIPGKDCPVRAFWMGIEETFTRALAETTIAAVVDRSRPSSSNVTPKAKRTAARGGRKKVRK